MPEPRDMCRDVTLPSGETVQVRGHEVPSPEATAALGELVDAARRLHAEQNPPDEGAAELWARVEAVRGDEAQFLRPMAKRAGVALSVLFRLRQGRMPGATDLAAIEAWLARWGAADA